MMTLMMMMMKMKYNYKITNFNSLKNFLKKKIHNSNNFMILILMMNHKIIIYNTNIPKIKIYLSKMIIMKIINKILLKFLTKMIKSINIK